MKIVSTGQEIGILTVNRVNVIVPTSGDSADDFEVMDKAFVVSVAEAGKLKMRTLGGQEDLFDFVPGDDATIYTKLLSDVENTLATISIRY